MSAPTLEILRRYVRARLRDFTEKIDPVEIDMELNRNLDRWTRDAGLIQQPLIQDIAANTNPQVLVPNPGFQVVRILTVRVNISGQDQQPLEIRTVEQMDMEIPNWRDSTVTDSTPTYAVIDFYASTPGQLPTPRSIWLWPWPSQALTKGLIVDHIAGTDNYLKADDTQIPLEGFQATEWLVETTCAVLSHRMKDHETGGYHDAEAKREGGKTRHRAYVERTTNRSSESYFV